jgi:oligopeptide/dipeptide ABC transporter ATP-binding protein
MALVEIDDLHVSFSQHEGLVQAVRGVSLELKRGESLGIVGESGSGKSVTCSALLRLLREPPAKITARRMTLDGHDVLAARPRELSALRGRVAAMVFQDPMTSLDPVFTVGHQIAETITAHRKVSKDEALAQAIALLKRVEIKNAEAVVRYYPHQLSGGMLQRVMIAIALSCEPAVLIADEPTTALDVTIQAQILQLIKDIQAETGMGLIMITHDLGVIAETVDRVLVMYGGKVMETGPVEEIFANPLHPYTRALLDSIPGQTAGKRRLVEIPGASPNPARPPNGCPFHPRCPMAIVACHQVTPPLEAKQPGRQAACIRVPAEAEMAVA